jgi:archaetidylinositol phosphate synthase
MLTKIKQQVQSALASEAKIAHRLGLTPNIVTVIGFIISILAAASYAYATTTQPLWLLLGVFLLMASGFCDTLDGILARTYQQASTFGAFFDSVLDRFADGLVLSGVILSGLCNIYIGLAALISSFMVSYCRARAEAVGVKMESIGIAERPERILILAGFSIVAFFWIPALNIGVGIIATLATITVIQRAIHAYKALKQKTKNTTPAAPQVKMTIGA